MPDFQLQIPEDQIKDFCRRNYIRSLALFGSVLSGDFDNESDIDVLVEFDPGHTPGLGLIRLQAELSGLFGGRSVDLVTPKFINRRILQNMKTKVIVPYGKK